LASDYTAFDVWCAVSVAFVNTFALKCHNAAMVGVSAPAIEKEEKYGQNLGILLFSVWYVYIAGTL